MVPDFCMERTTYPSNHSSIQYSLILTNVSTGSIWFILPALGLLFDMGDIRSDIKFIFQVFGELIRRIYTAVLAACASEVDGVMIEAALQIIFHG